MGGGGKDPKAGGSSRRVERAIKCFVQFGWEQSTSSVHANAFHWESRLIPDLINVNKVCVELTSRPAIDTRSTTSTLWRTDEDTTWISGAEFAGDGAKDVLLRVACCVEDGGGR